MKKCIYAIFDKKLNDFTEAYFRPSDGVASREFMDMVNDNKQKNPLFEHSADFALWKLGEIDTNNREAPVTTNLELIAEAEKVKIANESEKRS